MAFYQNQQQFNIPQNLNSPQNELQQQNQPNYPQLSPLPSQQTDNQQYQQQQNVNLYNENNNQQDGNLNQEFQQMNPNLENNSNMQIGGNFAKRFEQVFKNSLNAQNQDQQELSGGAPFMDQFKKQFAQNLAQNMMNNILQEELQQSKQKFLQTNQNQQGVQQSQAEADKSLFQKCCACLTLDFYKPYFNVTTDIVKDRLLYSFNPLNEGFFQLHNEYKPDLYGPFWILTTLIFTLTAAGNLSAYLQMPSNQVNNFNFNFNFVPFAGTVCYGFGFAFPILLTWLIKFFGTEQLGYLQMICIYGYSMAAFIPVSILCSIPSQILQWLAMAYATLNSTFFLINNVTNYLRSFQEKRQQIVQVLIFIFQLLLLLLYKIYFFQDIYYTYTIEESSNTSVNTTFNNHHSNKQHQWGGA